MTILFHFKFVKNYMKINKQTNKNIKNRIKHFRAFWPEN